MPCVRGHALSMPAIPGGTATNDTSAAQTMAVLRRGGMLPQASGYPAAMRATRALLRRRMPRMRTRAELLAHRQNTHRQAPWPEMGQPSADKAHRDGGAERFPEPAVQKSVAVDLARSDFYDPWLRAGALPMVQTAKPHDAQPLDRRQSVPGMGTMLHLVRLYELHEMSRVPRVQDFVSACRLGKCAQESAGNRYGTAGTQSGQASLTWAFSDAAVLC